MRTPRLRLAGALVAGAVVAWTGTVLFDVWWPFAEQYLRRGEYEGEPLSVDHFVGATLLYAIFGLPIALTFCVVVGWPLFRLADKSILRAIVMGASVGLVLAIAVTLYSEITGRSSTGDFNDWSYGRQVIKHNVLTAYGWTLQLRSTFVTGFIGAAVGATIWFVAFHRSGRSTI